MKFNKVAIPDDGYYAIMVFGTACLGIATAIGLGFVYSGFAPVYNDQIVAAGFGIGFLSVLPCSVFCWVMLSLLISKGN